MHKTFRLIILFFGLLLLNSVNAQSLYRCGSTYQDRPCDGNQKGGKLVGGMSGAPTVAKVSDSECAKRGTDAQKIVWAREGGSLQDQQLAKASSAAEQKLVTDVYAKRGTSSDIRAAIEAECLAAKEKAARTAALLEAANAQQAPSGATPNKPAETNQKTAPTANAETNSAREATSKKTQCDNLTNQLGTISSSQRAGGNAARMESLSQQKRELDRMLKDAGC